MAQGQYHRNAFRRGDSKRPPRQSAKLRNTHKLGTTSKHFQPRLIDMRSKEALFMKKIKQELVAHIGGTPTYVQNDIIERIAWLKLRLHLFDAKMMTGTFTE